MKWLKTFFASFDNVPTTGFHAVVSAFLALVSVSVVLGAMVLGRPVNVEAAIAVFTFDLGYLTKTSYDFKHKRNTDADMLVAKKLAENATPPTSVQVHGETVTAGNGTATAVTTKPALPPDLAQALRGGGPRPKGDDEGLG